MKSPTEVRDGHSLGIIYINPNIQATLGNLADEKKWCQRCFPLRDRRNTVARKPETPAGGEELMRPGARALVMTKLVSFPLYGWSQLPNLPFWCCWAMQGMRGDRNSVRPGVILVRALPQDLDPKRPPWQFHQPFFVSQEPPKCGGLEGYLECWKKLVLAAVG